MSTSSAPGASRTPTCAVVRSQRTFQGKQNLTYGVGISAQNVGAQALCMNTVTIPPGGRSLAHLHERHETALYVLNGQIELWYGEGLKEYLIAEQGDYVYIPASMPHLAANRSQTEPCVAMVARTDANEEESLVLLPELERGG